MCITYYYIAIAIGEIYLLLLTKAYRCFSYELS